MRFKKHLALEGTHAFLSASKPAWVNYTDEELDERYNAAWAAQRGSELHLFAAEAIRLRRRQPDTQDTLNLYVNDAIGYRMRPEQTLFVSYNSFGTCDAISFRDNMLRIHDLKTGVNKASWTQLEIYAAYFCLEYADAGVRPLEIDMELRIYQHNQIYVHEELDPQKIVHIMGKIVAFDRRINVLREEAEA